MTKTWLWFIILIGSIVMGTLTGLNGQSHWHASSCGNFAPTLDRIVINSCAKFEPDEHFIFHTNNGSLKVIGRELSIQINVTNGSYVADSWSSNPDALETMNQQSGCKKKLFLDPFQAPYYGTIPPHANVIAYTQRIPDFEANLYGLCNLEAIFVLFGNYSPGFIKSMFANSCGSKPDCTRHITVNLGSCKYDIVYEPDTLLNKNGDYIYGRGRSLQYANASDCKPAFERSGRTPDPKLNRKELSICKNDTLSPDEFSVENGNDFTSWYEMLGKPPIHQRICTLGSYYNSHKSELLPQIMCYKKP